MKKDSVENAIKNIQIRGKLVAESSIRQTGASIKNLERERSPPHVSHASASLGAVSLAGSLIDKVPSPILAELTRDIRLSREEMKEQGYLVDDQSVGDLRRDGFSIQKHNWKWRQDAAAVNLAAGRFAVSDGMGGYGFDKEGTAWFAQFLATIAVKYGIDPLLDPYSSTPIIKVGEELFEDMHGRKLVAPSDMIRGSTLGTIGATLTFAEAVSADEMRVVCIGDSPAFVLGENIMQYGEDAQTGNSDLPLRNFFGIASDRRVVLPNTMSDSMGRHIVDIKLKMHENQLLALGTDYFSDTDPRAFIGASPKDFGNLVESRGKLDDATLILISTQRL